MLKRGLNTLKRHVTLTSMRCLHSKQSGVEDMDHILQGLESKLKEADLQKKGGDILDRDLPYVYQQKGSVIFIRGQEQPW